ncbi:MAG TPA: GDP-mannose 4,6-dehydratase [Lentimicrobium sp.]|nr:GDP-mannose 4,6-dehydratase [Lentimicrobium sp.]
MRKILVTGAAGFIGSNLVKSLLDRNNSVIGIDNFDNFYDPGLKRQNIASFASHPQFTLFEGDIRDEAFLKSVFSETHPECVVHLAARAGVRPSIDDPELYYDVNVTGTLKLLEAMRRQGIKKLVFASSSSVYGNNTKIPFSETDNVDNPVSPYAATKKAGELLCYTYHHLYDFDVFCMRFFTVYGHNQRPEMAIQKFGRLINEGNPITMYGDGSTKRDYTFIDDIISGLLAAIEKVKGYEIINLGNHQTVMLKDLIAYISEILGKEAIIDQKPNQPGDVELTYADVSKAKQLLGYEPKYPIKTGLTAMFKHKIIH